jgi:hypothetical protein
MSDRKIHDDTHRIPARRGNGILRREVWVDEKGRVTRYNLAYINHALLGEDNGRVLGYDNQHGCHHRHRLGTVEPVEFTGYLDIEARFEREWRELHP